MPNEIDNLVDCLLGIMTHSWQETGFGRIEIQSERVKHNRIAVTILGYTHYRYVFSDEDVQKWCDKSEKFPSKQDII